MTITLLIWSLLTLYACSAVGQRVRIDTIYVTKTITTTETIPAGIYFVNTISAVGLAAMSSHLQAVGFPEMHYVTNVQGLHLLDSEATCVQMTTKTV